MKQVTLTLFAETPTLGDMKTLLRSIFFSLFLATFVSCSSDDYPLSTCVVSGEELGAHGDPYVHEHNGNIVKFCCKPCLDDFNEDPVKFLAKLERQLP